ncbi:MAG: glycosyltransferase family 9 protein [Gemmatimonadota bacterium]|nr:glycosyltransferase family 9 protein [Gemmatimonadota bacterium]
MTGHPSVLVIRFGALGDVVLTTPLLRAIGRAFPAARITFVTKTAWVPLLASHPHVARVEALAPGEPVHALAARLRDTRWDHRIDLHGSLRSRVLRILTGGRWHGWHKPRLQRAVRVWTGLAVGSVPPVAEQYFGAVGHLGLEPDGGPPMVVATEQDAARAAEVMPPERFVALAPGAAHATKRWPGRHWDRVVELLAHWGVPCVIVGTAEDAHRVTARGAITACGVGLGATAALLRSASVVIAGDSGLMHLATAVGTPVVALFGPTDPALGYAPYRSAAVVLARTLPCRPCSVYGGSH